MAKKQSVSPSTFGTDLSWLANEFSVLTSAVPVKGRCFFFKVLIISSDQSRIGGASTVQKCFVVCTDLKGRCINVACALFVQMLPQWITTPGANGTLAKVAIFTESRPPVTTFHFYL